MELESKITVHRFSGSEGSSASKRPVRISIIRGKSNRTIYLADDDAARLADVIQTAFRSPTDGWKGELKGE